MKILAFDTSNQPLSVAVVEDEKVLTEITVNIKRNHSIQLMPAIDEALKQANLTLDDIDRVAVAEGPGSYTGLRIAVTVAKSLAWTKDIELVGISSLKLVAANSSFQKEKLIVPLFDARRRNIYTGVYAYNDHGKLIQVTDDTHVSAEQWADVLVDLVPTNEIEFIGVDAPDFIELFKEKIGNRARLAKPEENLPRASVLALLAQKENPVDVHAFAPTYLKLAEAEENWLKEHPDFEGGNLVEKV